MTMLASTGGAIAMAVGGILAVLAISTAFYLIGRGEDRDRAAPPGAATPPSAAPEAAVDTRPADGDAPAVPVHPRPAATMRRRRRR
jgi:hypothetical protein